LGYYSSFRRYLLLDELCGVPLESLLAGQAAKMVGFAFISDFELGRIFIENYTADWVSEHYLSLSLMEESTFYLLWLAVTKRVL
jgi:hypothetical protein